jgi:hypothetical protein
LELIGPHAMALMAVDSGVGGDANWSVEDKEMREDN